MPYIDHDEPVLIHRSKVPREEIEDVFQNLQHDTNNNSLLKRYLTRDVFEMLKPRVTPAGGTLLDVVRSGVENPVSKVGVYAADPESYEVFAPLLRPLIEDYHKVNLASLPLVGSTQWTGVPTLPQSLEKYIISTRIRAARSIHGFPFHPLMSRHQYTEVEELFTAAITCLPLELAGTYYSWANMNVADITHMQEQKCLFLPASSDSCLRAAHAENHHPLGRGVFVSSTGHFRVWVNEEDHLRIMVVTTGASFEAAYHVITTALDVFEATLDFVKDPVLGYLTFCPTNIGSTIRASVHARLPQLSQQVPRLKQLADDHSLQVRSGAGEIGGSNFTDSIFDISNKRRLGVDLPEIIAQLYTGLAAICSVEQKLERAVNGGVAESME